MTPISTPQVPGKFSPVILHDDWSHRPRGHFFDWGVEVRLTPLPPRSHLIGKKEIGDNRTSASRESPNFHKLLTEKHLFSEA